MHFAVINQSTIVSLRDCYAIVAALRIQAKHAAHPWDRLQPTVSYHKLDDCPEDSVRLTILDDPDQAGALGYHTVDPKGFPTAKIFARLLDRNLDGASSVSSCVSHEFLEAFGDPTCLLWDTYDDAGNQIAHELCDPVQNDFYTIRTPIYGAVDVSNFVLPNYFNPWATEQFDYMNKLSGPAPYISPNGYAIVANESGEKQIFGKVPLWKNEVGFRTKARVVEE